MRFVAAAVGAVLGLLIPAANADESLHGGRRASAPTRPSWDFAITAYPTFVRTGDNYTSAIAAADRGPLHLEARYNYESIGSRSAFIGWTFAGGDAVTYELTPILGGVWGSTRGFVPGVELSAAWQRFDIYLEAEYVRDSSNLDDSYLYAWSELGFRPLEWLRIGVAGQRTRAYGGSRDLQRGPLAQVSWRRFTLGGYWFNPGSSDQVVITMISATF